MPTNFVSPLASNKMIFFAESEVILVLLEGNHTMALGLGERSRSGRSFNFISLTASYVPHC